MSGDAKMLEINKCILSKLWYTSFVIYQESNNKSSQYNINAIDFIKAGNAIANFIHSHKDGKHLWITYILLHKLSTKVTVDIKHIEKQQNYIQIENALQLCKNVTIHLKQRLMAICRNNSERTVSEILEEIHNDYYIFFKQNVFNNPFTICCILNELLSTCYKTSANVACNLQDFYFSILKEVFEFKSSTQKPISDNSLGCLLCIISKIDIVEFDVLLSLKWLFPMLLKATDTQDVQLALYARGDEQLFKKWCIFLDEVSIYSTSVNNLDDALKVQNVLFNITSIPGCTINNNKLIQRVTNNKLHWLTDFLDICYTLVINRKYSDVSAIVSCDLLSAIWPVLLLKVWNNYSQNEVFLINSQKDYAFICSSIEFLISMCNFDAFCDSTLSELENLLWKNTKILKYILNCIRQNVDVDDSSHMQKTTKSVDAQQNTSMKGISNVQYFNSLLVLKMATNIHEEKHNEIRHLLKDLYEPVNIFNAYSGLLSALKAILLCDSYDLKESTITSYFSDMKHYVQQLYPLCLRIEVIENIFCLLFLRHEDFNYVQKSIVNNSHEQLGYEDRMMKQYTIGFICNKYAVVNILLCLKEITAETEIEYMNMKSKNENTQEIGNIQKTIASINAAIADATWRLDLYMNSTSTENANVNDGNKSCLQIPRTHNFLEGKLISNHIMGSVYFYDEDRISDEVKIRSNSSSESESLYNTKRRKRKSTTLITAGIIDVTHKSLCINSMLASIESLIIRCLWRNDYVTAENIIQAFDMKNTQLNGEMQFSKSLDLFRKNMHEEAIALQDENLSLESLQSSILENIILAVREGLHSSKQISQLETFLASQEANLQMLSMEICNNTEMLTICALDLALTLCQIPQNSHNVCEVALKYLKLCKTFDNTEYAHFFYKFYQLLYEKKNELSIKNVLCDAKIPLSLKEKKDKQDFWIEIINKHCEFKESQLNQNSTNKTLKDSNYLSGLKLLGKKLTVCGGTKGYMQNMFTHLQLLHTIIPTKHAILTVSDLLRIPLHYYFGYQIFELEIEPNKLEQIAHDLQINLAYSILTNACPRLFDASDINSVAITAESGCIILNKTSCKSDLNYKIEGINQCVSEILAEALEILHNLNLNEFQLNHNVCKTISMDPDLRNVLSKTSCLVSLDLSELSLGDETLTFLLNIWNLMFLHTTLTVWAHDPPFNNLQHAVSLMSIGYLIGDLGLVTLAALRSKLLNNMKFDDKFFMGVEELNEPAWQDLDIAHDPRVVFAMANEYFGTPRTRVYNTQSLEEDLTNAFHDYLEHYTLPCEKSKQNIEKQNTIVLPIIVERYQSYIASNLKSDGQNNKNNHNSLVFMNEYLKSCNKNINIQYMAPSYSYSIILEYSNSFNRYYHKEVQTEAILKTYNIRSSLLQYLDSQCWVVSYLLQRIHNESPTILENDCENLKRTACLENLLVSYWMEELKPLFENNQTLAAIFETMPEQKLWSHFELILKENKWDTCLKLINALPNHLALNPKVQYFKDKVISHIVSQKDSTQNTKILDYLYQIKDIYILSQTVLYNINTWHINNCENALLYAVHHIDNYKLPVYFKLQLNENLHRVLVFHKMFPYSISKPNNTWYDIAYCTEKIDPLQIIKSMMNAEKFELCLEWMECQAFSLEIHPSMTLEFLIGLLKSESQNYKQTLKFFQALPLDQSINLCKTVLTKLDSIDSLRFICGYLLQYCKATETIKYRRTLLGIDILSMLDDQERLLYIHLIKKPLLMLEQLLMNCKFESIQRILSKTQDKLEHVDISRSSFDTVIRFYAKKSLDCRVSLQCDSNESKPKNVYSSTSEAENTAFIMPIIVPTKEEWMPNDKAKKCSCCKNVIFSMFNRRHHCRRCGRVICATCSQHRMQVSSYPSSVLVRVCDECKRQTALHIHAVHGTASTPSSEIFDCWKLTRDQKHNETIREEFSFEYAPNISLCLAILNLHSEHETYTSFLLDCCDEMKRLLQPVSGGRVNPEVDHTVINKMIRSLLVAAKVKCAKLGLNMGLAHCDRFLSQVDLIASLVQSDCLHLIPSDSMEEYTSRKLRDFLIEKEQWTLALDVSTKDGLDTQGVWATWGKACLKIGYFDQAREKFLHCLDKVQYESFEDWVILPYLKDSKSSNMKEIHKSTKKCNEDEVIEMDELSSRKMDFSKNRPLKDPPLLTEILQILDNLRVYKQYVQYSHEFKSNTSQEILHNYGNIIVANQKQFNTKNTSATAENIYYKESLHYLLNYGSYYSILEFFWKYEELDKCLSFTLNNDLDPDIFFNAIYLHCLKNGNIEKLHGVMMHMDPSLLIWKRYLIYVCHSLEKRQSLNILYQLQLFMKDSIRAAMTCIRFYLNEVNSYTELCAKANFLLNAQKHLESELQIETLNRKRRKSTTSVQSNQGILTMEMEPSEIDKHINTICRQMEITKFLANCEKEERVPIQFLKLYPGKDSDALQVVEVPTLFGNQQQKIDLAVLAILCGRNIEEGFGIAFRIMQDYNLPQQKVYSLAGHILTVKNNISAIEQLIKCCHTSGIPNSHIISDYVLSHCVKLLLNRVHNEAESLLRNDVYNLVRLITDIELKINAYIECKQLKSAYLLAVKHSRAQDIRKILKESERLSQNAIKAICIKWLQKEPKLAI